MKRNLYILTISLIIASTLFSCNFSSEPKEITVEDKYKIVVPGYMRSRNSLNKDASMVYINSVKEVYIMVIDESRERIDQFIEENDWEDEYTTDFDGYCQLACRQDGEYFLTPDDYKQLKDGTINGLRARFFENTRMINNVKAFYTLALIEGEDTYYQVISWTLPDRVNKYKETLENMIHSFEEL